MMQQEPCEVDVPVREGGQTQNPIWRKEVGSGARGVCVRTCVPFLSQWLGQAL